MVTTHVSELGDGRYGLSNGSTAKTGRRTFKTMKKGNNAIWSDALETALLQALASYTPPPARSMKASLMRFPKRNKAISEYIYKVTGIVRTQKQVGSRLQQLQKTCKDPEVLQHLKDRARFRGTGQSTSSSTRLLSTRSARPEESALPTLLPPPEPSVVITAPAPLTTSFSHTVNLEVTVVDDDWSHTSRSPPHLIINLDNFNNTISKRITTPTCHLSLAPLVTVGSHNLNSDAYLYRTTFTTYCNGEVVNSHHCDVPSKYKSTEVVTYLAPGFWHNIVETLNGNNQVFTVVQTIRSIGPLFVQIELTYNIRLSYQCPRLPSTSASYDLPVAAYASQSHIYPAAGLHFGYANFPSSSAPIPVSSVAPDFAFQLPLSTTGAEPYMGEVWPNMAVF
ncbi:hypothetical protein DFP72DRAFT_1076670 [Ephemerocybe angulata]|uniref:TEA domain-containing protein n=1 Tax=Ephemerocybe angulata TaxID=980116 RepID=A0A8H6HFI3_9AGAR|nr:hypothetical protein DFP72DRAFT_1076670 [Tulosesus angulatus]